MKPHAMSCFCHRQNHLKTIPNLLSLCVIILSFLALLHFSYRHVLFQLSFYACSNPSSSSLASANSSSSAIATAAAIGPPGVGGANSTSGANATAECDIFRGEWVPDPEGPYYTNVTCTMIQDHQNCMRFGRPDREFLQWRWKPEGCELPRFDPHRFLELARGKSMAFVGDSLARNHMQSLLCLLSGVEYPDDISNTRDENRRLFYSDYNFTVSIFWSPFLIKGGAAGGVDNLWNLYLDEVDDNWAARVQAVDILIISSGTWFTRPSIYFKKRQPFGCNYCAQSPNLTRVSLYSVNRAAFRSAFKAIGKLRGFRGVTVLRTVSPSHFENGKWDQGGSCNRTRPARREETRLEAVELEMYRAQVKEFERARREWERTGLQLKMMDATAAMLMRPDGHPDVYGHRPEQRVQLHNDCVHWCLPGPIDLWNDLLLQMLSNRASEQSGTQQIIP